MNPATATEAAPFSLEDAARTSAAWPFEQARNLVARLEKSGKREALFETGYGPSGLPHIGTFNEVARTTFVRQAYEELTSNPTRLVAFSDDMDGLRKVPDNVPNQQLLAENLGKPLTRIPDPFGTHESFAHHNNATLRHFLDRYGFDYEFLSATDCYTSGRFDDVTSIQRLSTVGGNAPTDGCDATHVGAIAQVPYSTDYVFYRAKPKGSVQQCGG